VSPDDAASHVSFINKYELPFQLLVDADHAVAEVYGVWTEKTTFGRKHFGILRSHFVIDEQGRIADARYRVSPAKSVELALAALDAMDSQDSQDSQDD
jgi:peroxiredoxin Q/BCP